VYVGLVLTRFTVCRVLRAIIGSKRDILLIYLFIYLFIYSFCFCRKRRKNCNLRL